MGSSFEPQARNLKLYFGGGGGEEGWGGGVEGDKGKRVQGRINEAERLVGDVDFSI